MAPSDLVQAPPPPPPPQWVLDINNPPIPKPKSTSIPDPPGYTPTQSQTLSKRGAAGSAAVTTSKRKPPSEDEMDVLKMKKAWEVAIAPAKALPMSAIGMWMSGNSLQIFSIFMLFQLFKAPVQGLLGMSAQFGRFESAGNRQKLVWVKVVYVLCNLLGVVLGIWKIDKMGLLPTTRSDWLAWESRRMPLERAVPGYSI